VNATLAPFTRNEFAPDNARRGDFKTTSATSQFTCGNLALFTVRAHVGVQQYLAVLSEHCITMGARSVHPFEIPFAPAFRAAVVRDHVDVSVHHVPMRAGIAPGSINSSLFVSRKTGGQNW
jgi:hypothetical protein